MIVSAYFCALSPSIAGGKREATCIFERQLIIEVALRGIEWVELAFPDVNMHVHMNVNVPENINSRALNIAINNAREQEFSAPVFVSGDVGRWVNKPTVVLQSLSGTFTFTRTFMSTFTRKYLIYHSKQWVMTHQQSSAPTRFRDEPQKLRL